MPAISSAPTPEQFAKAWTRGFAAAVRSASGIDGRLSFKEAQRRAVEGGELAVYMDNALNYLSATHQESVDVDKLIASGYRYAYHSAKALAGNGNRISLEEARDLRLDLREDYYILRGKSVPNDVKNLSLAQLWSAATDWVLQNSQPFPDAGYDKPLPPLSHGENGTGSFVLDGRDAERVMEVLKVRWGSDTSAYSPETHAVIYTQGTSDESNFYVSVIRRDNGEVTPVAHNINPADLFVEASVDQFEELMGESFTHYIENGAEVRKELKDVTDPEELAELRQKYFDPDSFKIIEGFVQRGRDLRVDIRQVYDRKGPSLLKHWRDATNRYDYVGGLSPTRVLADVQRIPTLTGYDRADLMHRMFEHEMLSRDYSIQDVGDITSHVPTSVTADTASEVAQMVADHGRPPKTDEALALATADIDKLIDKLGPKSQVSVWRFEAPASSRYAPGNPTGHTKGMILLNEQTGHYFRVYRGVKASG